jgi:hypothetical protein
VSDIKWRDAETLLTVIEARFEASAAGSPDPADLWSKYFCPRVSDKQTRDFITSVVLPRPRDIVYFCNEAVNRALDRHHARVEPDDFYAAEETYSQWAFEALLVENGVTIPDMRKALFGFLCSREILTRREIYSCLEAAELGNDRHERVLMKLILASFLGIEVKQGEFAFPEVGTEMARAEVQASRLTPEFEGRRFRIHRAFHSFLDVSKIEED